MADILDSIRVCHSIRQADINSAVLRASFLHIQGLVLHLAVLPPYGRRESDLPEIPEAAAETLPRVHPQAAGQKRVMGYIWMS